MKYVNNDREAFSYPTEEELAQELEELEYEILNEEERIGKE